MRAVEMTQQLRAPIVLPEHLSLVPSTHIGQLAAVCNSSSKEPVLSSVGTCTHWHILRHRHRNTHIIKT